MSTARTLATAAIALAFGPAGAQEPLIERTVRDDRGWHTITCPASAETARGLDTSRCRAQIRDPWDGTKHGYGLRPAPEARTGDRYGDAQVAVREALLVRDEHTGRDRAAAPREALRAARRQQAQAAAGTSRDGGQGQIAVLALAGARALAAEGRVRHRAALETLVESHMAWLERGLPTSTRHRWVCLAARPAWCLSYERREGEGASRVHRVWREEELDGPLRETLTQCLDAKTCRPQGTQSVFVYDPGGRELGRNGDPGE